nr:L-lactate permease [uncultured Megasphaera sp.]
MVILALLPILFLIVALGFLKMAGWKACPIAAIISFIVAVACYNMPVPIAISAALEGVALACWPILLVIIMALFAYKMTVATGGLDTIKQMLTTVSEDKRVLFLLIAWGFGTFMEGMAGFGTAVAIPAAMLVALGYPPIKTIVGCLIANAVAPSFGSIGIPTTTMAAVTGLDPVLLATKVSIVSFIPDLIAPFLIVICIGGGLKAIKGVGIVTLLSGLALAIPELFISMTIGAELPVMVSSIIIMAVIVLYSKASKTTSNPEYQVHFEDGAEKKTVSFGEGVKASMIFILIFVLLVGTSKLFPFINGPLASIKTTVPIYMGAGAKPYTFTWIAVPGVMIFIATILGALYQGASGSKIAQVFKDNFVGLRYTYLTIITVVIVAKIMTYSGMTKEIADALVFATGNAYPIIAPFVGGLGAFITGSCTNANVLFAPLQVSVAQSLGMSQPWLAGASSLGGCIGKMLSPQSIALGVGAVGAVVDGKEGEIMRGTFGYCLFMLIIAGIITIIAPSIVPFLVN